MNMEIDLRNPLAQQRYIKALLRDNIIRDTGVFSISPVEGGLLNYVYRVRGQASNFYLKQALGKPECMGRSQFIGDDLAGISPSRLKFERNFINLINSSMIEFAQEILLANVF